MALSSPGSPLSFTGSMCPGPRPASLFRTCGHVWNQGLALPFASVGLSPQPPGASQVCLRHEWMGSILVRIQGLGPLPRQPITALPPAPGSWWLQGGSVWCKDEK